MTLPKKVIFILCKLLPAAEEGRPAAGEGRSAVGRREMMLKSQKNHHNSGNIHFQRVPIFVTPPPWVEVPQMQTKLESFPFWDLLLPFREDSKLK